MSFHSAFMLHVQQRPVPARTETCNSQFPMIHAIYAKLYSLKWLICTHGREGMQGSGVSFVRTLAHEGVPVVHKPALL